MVISELIKVLKKFKKDHGDLLCVISGPKEDRYNDINTVELTRIKSYADEPNTHRGVHESCKYDMPKDGELALELNF